MGLKEALILVTYVFGSATVLGIIGGLIADYDRVEAHFKEVWGLP